VDVEPDVAWLKDQLFLVEQVQFSIVPGQAIRTDENRGIVQPAVLNFAKAADNPDVVAGRSLAPGLASRARQPFRHGTKAIGVEFVARNDQFGQDDEARAARGGCLDKLKGPRSVGFGVEGLAPHLNDGYL